MLPRPKDYERAKRRVELVLERPPESADAVIEGFITATADVLGASSSCWHRTDPATSLPVSGSVLGDPPGSIEEALEYEFRRPDVNRLQELRDRRTPAAAISIETRGQLSSSARFREMIEPTGAVDELRLSFGDAFGTWAAAAIFTERRITIDDLRFLGALVPAATAALRAAIAAETLAAPESAAAAADGGGPAVLILDGSDHVVAADAAARQRLTLLPENRNVQLPGVISFLASKARFGGTDQPATARMRTQDGRWLILDASTLDDAPNANVAVVMQPAPHGAVLDGILRSLGLTAREREIASLVVQGRSTKAIATTLMLSAWTVQDHLKAIYEKTGVRTRSDLGAFAARQLAAPPRPRDSSHHCRARATARSTAAPAPPPPHAVEIAGKSSLSGTRRRDRPRSDIPADRWSGNGRSTVRSPLNSES